MSCGLIATHHAIITNALNLAMEDVMRLRQPISRANAHLM